MALEDLPCLTDEQTFVIEFLETRNRPPVFTSTPVTFAALSPSIGPNQPMILSDWTVTQFAGGDPAPSWVVAPSGTSVEQQLNSDPSFFLSDFESVGERIDGTWYVNAGDNDYVGFVFGYQEAAHFYLMSWKAGTQGAALSGIDVRSFHADDGTPLWAGDFWPTAIDDERVTNLTYDWTLGRNLYTVGWLAGHLYRYTLDFVPGTISITIRDLTSGTTVAAFSVNDDRYTSGKFGFYNYSQPRVTYSGFSRAPLFTADYLYSSLAVDPDGDPVSYSLISGPETMSISPSGELSWMPTLADVGAHMVVIRATDPAGAFTEQSFVLSVENERPVFLTEPPTSVRAGALYAYVPEVADPNGQSVTYTLDEAPIGMTVELSGRLLWVPGLYQLGSHQVTLRATDPDGNFELQTFVVEVVANAPPQLTSIAPVSGTEARLYHYRVVAADPDPGDLLAYDLVVAPDGAVFDSGLLTGELLWTPTDAQTGPQRFQVAVTDLSEATAVQDWIVEVTDINTPPAFVSVPPSVAGVGQDLAYRVEAVDPDAKDAGKLVYSLSRGPRGMVLDRATNVLHFTATPDQVGVHRVDLRAADPLGLVGYQSFWLRVSLAGLPPEIVSKPPRGASVGYVLRYQVEATHPDAVAVLTFGLDVGPAGATLGASSGLLEWTPFTAGEATFSIRVSDQLGESDVQTFAIPVLEGNAPPVFASIALTHAKQDEVYQYQAAVTDDPGDDHEWVMVVGPPGASISATGLVSWTPGAAEVGSHAFVIRAIDRGGLEATQSYSVSVENVNDPPVFVSVPPTHATVGATLAYEARATDPDAGDVLTYSLVSGPADAVVDPITGRLSYVIPAGIVSAAFTLRATDAQGLSAEQSFVVIADADTSAPSVTLSVSPATVAPGVPVLISATATDNVSAELVVTVNGVPVSLSSVGTAVFTSSVPGAYRVEAVASDPAGNETRRTVSFGIHVAGDSAPPALALTSPAEDQVVTFLADVAGSIVESNLLSWALTMVNNGDGQTTMVASGDSAPPSGAFGKVDATLLTNGLYTLRLEATDVNGLTSILERPIEVDGAAKVGIFTVSFNDLTIPVSGIPITVTRTYDSRVKVKKDFGVGWELSVAAGKFTANRKLGDGWTITKKVGFGQPPCGQVNEPKRHRVEVRLSDREVFRFVPRLIDTSGGLGFCEGQMVFVDAGSVRPGAAMSIIGQSWVWQQTGESLLRDPDTLVVFDPQDVRLTTPEGVVFDVNRKKGITRIQDRNANVLRVTASGITSNTGLGVAFHRDGEGRIDSITDPLGRVLRYGYDASGDLVSFKDPLLNETTFRYLASPAHHLEGITNALGVRAVRNEFDDDGRFVAEIDAFGNRTEVEHDLAAQVDRRMDPEGRIFSFYYDVRGNLTRFSNSVGEHWDFEYDARDNRTRMTNPMLEQTDWTYDASSRVLSKTRPHGPADNPEYFTTRLEYDSFGRTTAVLLPTGGRFDLTYDQRGNLREVRDGLGNLVERFEYDYAGRRTRTTAAFVDFQSTYNPVGYEVASLDLLNWETTAASFNLSGALMSLTTTGGIAISHVLDALNRPVLSDYGEGVTLQRTYSINSEIETLEGPTLPRLERLETDRGEFGGWQRADGTGTKYSYGPSGLLDETTDAAGRTTSYDHDAAGRLVSVRAPDGAETIFVRDAAGRVTTTLQPGGGEVTEAFGPSGRVESRTIKTAAGSSTWGFVNTPTVTTLRSPLGIDTTVIKNEYGLTLGVVFDDGTSEENTYAAQTAAESGNEYPLSVRDTEGRTRLFSYTPAGLLAKATDLGGAVYHYGYDARSRRTSITWPSGTESRTTIFDNADRETSTVLADGSGEHQTYHPSGQLASVTRRLGTIEFAYDSLNRLIQRTAADGTVGFSHDAIDRVTAVSEAAGQTLYSYDVHGEIERVTLASNAYVRYERDALARLTLVAFCLSGVGEEYVTEYKYGPAGELLSVTDPFGGLSTFGYDADLRAVARTLPNGVKTTLRFDHRDRPTSVEHSGPGGAVLFSEEYDLNPTGEPLQIMREDGSVAEYLYDPSNRIAREIHRAPGAAVADELSYSYDSDGRRETRTTAAGPERYVYAPGHRLVEVQRERATDSFNVDDDGRVTGIDRQGRTVSIGYDSFDHVTSVATVGGIGSTLLSYTTDAEGRTLASTGALPRGFVVAPTHESGRANIHAITDVAGQLLAGFVFVGDLPLMRFGPSGVVYYLQDRIGSTRALVDSAGDLAGTLDYDAFGNERASSIPVPPGLGGDFGFQGLWLEQATGLIHTGERAYDPSTGRFLSRDSFAGDVRIPESLDPYAFANGNPQLYRDPNGSSSMLEIFSGLGVQSNLRRVEILAKNQIKDQALEYAERAVGKLGKTAIESVFPQLQAHEYYKYLDLGSLTAEQESATFEGLLTDIFCDVAIFGDITYIGPAVNQNTGQAVDNGINCNTSKTNFHSLPNGTTLKLRPQVVVPHRDASRPDFILSPVPPERAKRGASFGGNTYVIGELKRHSKNAEFNDSSGQFRALYRHADAYGSNIVVGAFIYYRQQDIAKYERKFLAKGVYFLDVGLFKR